MYSSATFEVLDMLVVAMYLCKVTSVFFVTCVLPCIYVFHLFQGGQAFLINLENAKYSVPTLKLIKCSTVCSANRQVETTSPQAVLCRVSHILNITVHFNFPSVHFSSVPSFVPSFVPVFLIFHIPSFAIFHLSSLVTYVQSSSDELHP